MTEGELLELAARWGLTLDPDEQSPDIGTVDQATSDIAKLLLYIRELRNEIIVLDEERTAAEKRPARPRPGAATRSRKKLAPSRKTKRTGRAR